MAVRPTQAGRAPDLSHPRRRSPRTGTSYGPGSVRVRGPRATRPRLGRAPAGAGLHRRAMEEAQGPRVRAGGGESGGGSCRPLGGQGGRPQQGSERQGAHSGRRLLSRTRAQTRALTCTSASASSGDAGVGMSPRPRLPARRRTARSLRRSCPRSQQTRPGQGAGVRLAHTFLPGGAPAPIPHPILSPAAQRPPQPVTNTELWGGGARAQREHRPLPTAGGAGC